MTTMTTGQITKAEWVKEWLAPFFRNVPRSPITDIEYKVDYEGFHEVLIITYEGGGKKQCNVSCDSPLAMVEDMYRQYMVY